MTAKTRRLREFLAADEFLYMPSAALHAMKRALGEIMASGSYIGFSEAEFTLVRKEIEDLIGLDAYYRIEAETVEPGSQPG
jgi:hypothetical protein